MAGWPTGAKRATLPVMGTGSCVLSALTSLGHE